MGPRDWTIMEVSSVREVRRDDLHGSLLGQRQPRQEGALESHPVRIEQVSRSDSSTQNGTGACVCGADHYHLSKAHQSIHPLTFTLACTVHVSSQQYP